MKEEPLNFFFFKTEGFPPEGPLKLEENVGGEFFLTPYLSEMLETLYFLVDLWHHREIMNGVDRVQAQLEAVDKKLDSIRNGDPPSGDSELSAEPIRRNGFAQFRQMVEMLKKMFKVTKWLMFKLQ